MAREIKFKFWDVTNKRFTDTLDYMDEFAITHEGELLHLDTRAVLNEKNGRVQHKFLYVYSKRNVVPLQYTGLKDKNGVEIYEGDILAGLGKKYAMEWSIYGWGLKKGGRVYTMDVGNILQNEWDADRKLTNFEVIGNIYENPELIQK